jgi:glycosyltransferase involved in cell wall biosynthesis
MKILLPYLSYNNHTLDDKKVIGGIEMFAKHIYDNIEETIPFYYTNEDRKKRLVTKKCIESINMHNPDVLVVNYDTATLTTRVQEVLDIPIVWIIHIRGGAISSLSLVEKMHSFVENGGVLCMVSEHQYHSYNKISLRNHLKNIPIFSFINSSFCLGNEIVSNKQLYEAITISRISKYKDTFWLFNKLPHNERNIALLTNEVDDFLYGENLKYYEKNKHFEKTHKIFKNFTHQKTMNILSQSKCYVSTCQNETWGITALEALSRGVPLILGTDGTNTHASENIAADASHYVKIKKTAKREDLLNAIDKLSTLTYNERISMSEQTKIKHSKEAWISNFYNVLNYAISNRKITPRTNIEDFFQ